MATTPPTASPVRVRREPRRGDEPPRRRTHLAILALFGGLVASLAGTLAVLAATAPTG